MIETTRDGKDAELLAKLTELGVITAITEKAEKKRLWLTILKTVLGVATSFLPFSDEIGGDPDGWQNTRRYIRVFTQR